MPLRAPATRLTLAVLVGGCLHCGGGGTLIDEERSLEFVAPDDSVTVAGRVDVTVRPDPLGGLEEVVLMAGGEPVVRWLPDFPSEPSTSLDTRTLPDGVAELTAVARWEDGEERDAVLAIRVDNTDPEISVAAPASDAARYLEDGTFAFEVRVSDAESGLSRGVVRVNGEVVMEVDPLAREEMIALVDPADFHDGALGESARLELSAEVFDRAGHSASVEVEVTVLSRLRWVFAASGNILTSPVLLPDGAIALGTNRGFLHVVEPDGTERCHVSAIDEVVAGGPTPTPDGAAVIWGTTRQLRMTSIADCSERWVHGTRTEWTGGPAVAPDGAVIATTFAGVMHALEPDTGATRWTLDLAAAAPGGGLVEVVSAAAVTDDGVILQGVKQGLTGGTVFAVDPIAPVDGEPASAMVRWAFESPAVRGDLLAHAGRVFFGGASDGRLYALSLFDGSRLWPREPDVGIGVQCTPAVLPDGSISVCDRSGAVALFDPGTGDERWSLQLLVDGAPSGLTSGGVTAGADGRSYLGDSLGVVHAVEPTGDLAWAFRTPAEDIRERPAIAEDTLYVGSVNDRLYALWTVDVMERP